MASKLRVVDERGAFRSTAIRTRSYRVPLKCQLLSVGYSSQTWGEHTDEKRASTLFVYTDNPLLNDNCRLWTN